MSLHRDLPRGSVLPASFIKALQEYVSGLSPTFAIAQLNATTLQIVAGAGDAQVPISIQGRYRYNTATVTAAHPGGAAGTYDVYVTATDNSFSDSPAPDTDNTVYTFGLAIRASGSPPASGLYRKVGTCVWSGSAITAFTQLVGTPIGSLVLNSDARLSDARTPVAHAASHAAGGSDYLKGTVPIGGQIIYCGVGDPPEGEWIQADGRLIRRDTYAAFFTRAQHVYNLGIDPGNDGSGNPLVRIPDKRGRSSIGALSFGTDGSNGVTAIGTGDTARVNATRGSKGGLREVALTDPGQNAPHGHAVTDPGHTHTPSGGGYFAQYLSGGGVVYYNGTGEARPGSTATAAAATGIGIQSSGGGVTHTNTHPWEADTVLVRIA